MTLWHRRISFLRILLSLILVLLLPMLSMVSPTHAQSGTIVWSEPIDISNSPQNSLTPAIVADDSGNVHVFWSEDADGGPKQPEALGNSGSAIYYTRWDGQSWTAPVDILIVPGEAIADFVSVKIDKENRLHAVWTGQTNIYYSNALASQAGSAHAWSQPQIIATNSARSRWESDVVVDSAGDVHIIYATGGEETGVYHIRSSDGGATWSPPVQLSLPPDALEMSFSQVKTLIDGAGRLHAVWQTNQIQGYGQAIYYARSLDNGDTWSPAVQLGYRGPADTWVEWPYLADMGNSELHLIYTNGTNKARAYRVSNDGGETWSEPRNVLNDLEGINGYNVPLVDGANQKHLLINMRSRATQEGGIWYAQWTGEDWSPAIGIFVGANSAHNMAVAVNRGNEIHVVWAEITPGEIWYTRGIVQGVTPQSVQAVPTPIPTAHPGPQKTPTITRSDLSLQTGINPALPSTTSAAGSPFIPGLIVAAVVVGGVIVFRLLRSTNR